MSLIKTINESCIEGSGTICKTHSADKGNDRAVCPECHIHIKVLV